MSEATEGRSWFRGTLILIVVLVSTRLVLEAAGADHAWTRYLSSSAVLFLAAIYLGAVAPLRGVVSFSKIVLAAMLLTMWTEGCVIAAIIVSRVLSFHGSHFAETADYASWAGLGHHIVEHALEVPVLAVLVLVMMTVPYVLRRWPVTVGPAAILGALVITRYWLEAMDVSPIRTAAWSSTVAVLLCGFYLGGIGPRVGVSSARQLLVPAIVIGWAWRFWIFLAAILSVLVPFFHTHFFDPSEGRVGIRLARFLVAGVIEGFVVGLVLWGVAVWISRATRETAGA